MKVGDLVEYSSGLVVTAIGKKEPAKIGIITALEAPGFARHSYERTSSAGLRAEILLGGGELKEVKQFSLKVIK